MSGTPSVTTSVGPADPALASASDTGGRASADWRRPIRPAPGPIRFARYAFGPNRLGYCGPDASAELFAQATQGGNEQGGRKAANGGLAKLRELAAQFEGAYPYLRLIAEANGRPDPLDPAVVEAYWLGGSLAAHVSARAFGSSLDDRFRNRIPNDRWRWLAAAADAGAVPNHAFHVLDVFPKVGLLRTGEIDRVVETMDACRIRWGRVLERDGDSLVVSTNPLALVNGQLRLSDARIQRVRGWVDGAGFVDDAEPGDVVSIHWDWACERLDAARLEHLRRSTAAELRMANGTI